MENVQQKLLFIYGPLAAGGAEKVLIDILKNLDHKKYEVDLCQIVGGGVLLKEVPKEVHIFNLYKNYSLDYRIAFRLSVLFGSNYLLKRKLKKSIKKKYDIEISFLEGLPLKMHALMDSTSKKITWVHADLLKNPYEAGQFYKKEEYRAYSKMDKIVCVSNHTAISYQKRFTDLDEKLEVIYNPVDVEEIVKKSQEIEIKKKRFTVAVVGRLTKVKAVHKVLYVAEKLKSSGIEMDFLIIGEGEERKYLEGLAQKLGVENAVAFLGYQANPYPYIKNADILLSTSESESFSLVICEAMALGVPVVSTKTAGPMEIIDGDKYGILCEHDDDAIFEAVKKIFEDKSLRMHYSQKGLERVSDFSVKKNIYNFKEMLTQFDL